MIIFYNNKFEKKRIIWYFALDYTLIRPFQGLVIHPNCSSCLKLHVFPSGIAQMTRCIPISKKLCCSSFAIICS